jgi:hypothetical protein
VLDRRGESLLAVSAVTLRFVDRQGDETTPPAGTTPRRGRVGAVATQDFLARVPLPCAKAPWTAPYPLHVGPTASQPERENGDVRRFLQSPLTDSNRRPPPYHRATRRESRACAVSRGHEDPASGRNRPKRSRRAWTRVPGRTFPQCSLRKSAGAPELSDEKTLGQVSLPRPPLSGRLPLRTI